MRLVLSSLALLSLAALSSAQTTTAYSSLGANQSYIGGYSYGPGNSSFTFAFRFTSNTTGTLAGFYAAIGYDNTSGGTSGPASPFDLTLYADQAGAVGRTLGTFGGTSSPNGTVGRASTVVFVPASGVSLTSGAAYWLTATTTGNVDLAWGTSPNGVETSRAGVVNGSQVGVISDIPTAFSVQVTPGVQATPEPVTMALGAAAFGVALRRRRRVSLAQRPSRFPS